MKLWQKKTMYNKVKHIYLEVKIDHMFYFSKEIPDSLLVGIWKMSMVMIRLTI